MGDTRGSNPQARTTNPPSDRYSVAAWHGEGRSLFYVLDGEMGGDPIESYTTRKEAEDAEERMNFDDANPDIAQAVEVLPVLVEARKQSDVVFDLLQWIVEFMDEHPDWTEKEFCNGTDASAEAWWLERARKAVAG